MTATTIETVRESGASLTTLQRLMQGVSMAQSERENAGPEAWMEHRTFCRCVLCR